MVQTCVWLLSDFCQKSDKSQTKVKLLSDFCQRSNKSQTKVQQQSIFMFLSCRLWVQSCGATLLIATHFAYGPIRWGNPPFAIRWGNPPVFAIGWVWLAYDGLDSFDQLLTTPNIIHHIIQVFKSVLATNQSHKSLLVISSLSNTSSKFIGFVEWHITQN